MFTNMQLKTKIMMLGALIAFALVFLGMTTIIQLGDFHKASLSNFAKVEQRVLLLSEVNHAHLDFKTQVQEWKNVLIRGNDKDQYEKYYSRFLQQSDKVQSQLSNAITLAKANGEDFAAIEQLKKDHAELKVAYVTALESFDERDQLTGKKVDKQVSGMDRPASKGLFEVSEVTEQRFNELLLQTRNRMDADYAEIKLTAILIMLSCSIVVLAIMIWIFRDLLLTLGGEPIYAAQVLNDVAEGKLNTRISLKAGDQKSLIYAIECMRQRLSDVIREVRSSADALASASEEVSSTSQSLAQGATIQATSVEQTSSSIKQMSASIEQNNENASVTDGIAQQTAKEAAVAGQAVLGTVSEMQKIAEKISVIDDIAYQTNLLALNAAIEAGRAGEQGKGFAVVASEVRKLAERSQVAAQEIGELAKESVKRADSAGRSLEEILPSISRTADLIQEIAASSSEQAHGVQQINSAIGQVSQTMQQNAAASEQLSATSEEMSAQAALLQETVNYFHLENRKSSHSSESRELQQGSSYKSKQAVKGKMTPVHANGDDDKGSDEPHFVRFS